MPVPTNPTLPILALMFVATLGIPAEASPPVAPTEALTPEEQRAAFKLPPGFEIQLVASEPEIQKPMNLAFDTRGRLWVTHSVRAIASSEGGTSIAVSLPKASEQWLPRAIEPTSRRTTRDCFNDPCNFFTLRGPDRPADGSNEAPSTDRHGRHRVVRGNLRG